MCPTYKDGKKDNILPFQQVRQKVIAANLSINEEAFFWLLYYCGVRKSEAYERVVSDFKITNTRIVVDFHQRKKKGATVPPLKLPLSWYGMNKLEYMVEKAKERRPRNKAVYVYVDHMRT
ncbi:MAG: tyrosine-type recombinase/integrase, partial [Candidatus Bathyarchaeota archaeon]